MTCAMGTREERAVTYVCNQTNLKVTYPPSSFHLSMFVNLVIFLIYFIHLSQQMLNYLCVHWVRCSL